MINVIDYITSPHNPFEMVLFIILIIIFSTILLRLITYSIKRLNNKEDIDMTRPYLLRNLLQYLIYFIAVLLILDVVGIDIRGILVSVGIVSIIIGFAAKDVISNFMSGLFLATDKTVKVGDEIVVDNIQGTVINITFRKITIRTADNVIVTIPNSILSTKPYKNNTNELPVVLTLIVYLKLNIDIEEYEKRVIKECEMLDFVNKDYNNKMNVVEINDLGIKAKLYVDIENQSEIERNRVVIANIAREILNDMDE